MCKNATIFTDTVETLQTIYNNGIKIAIVSAKDKETISTIAKQYDFLKYIDIIIGENEVKKQKPFPEQVNMALSVLSLNPSDAVYIGDSLTDALAANNACVDFIAVTTGFTKTASFIEIPNIAIMKNLTSCLDLIITSR